jgi:probable rRNA maturation factor
LRRLAIAALERLDAGQVEVGVLICDDATIRTLNRHFRAKDAPTDVLSFPAGFAQPDGPLYLGDIAISLETAGRQAARAGVALERELKTLLLHALIHLCGHDHETDGGKMTAIEVKLRRELIG